MFIFIVMQGDLLKSRWRSLLMDNHSSIFLSRHSSKSKIDSVFLCFVLIRFDYLIICLSVYVLLVHIEFCFKSNNCYSKDYLD